MMHFIKSLFRPKFPLVLQGEISECGLACLVMVFNWYHAHVDLASLRELYPTSLKGLTLNNLVRIAKNFYFHCSVLKIEPSQMFTLKFPVIVHWDMNHFVVVKQVTKKSVLIYDPAMGKRSISYATFSEHFTGIALELYPDKNFTPITLKKTLSITTLVGSLKSFKKNIFAISLFAILLQIFIILSPQYIQRSVDAIQTIHAVSSLVFLTLLFLGLKLLEGGVGAIRNYGIHYFGSKLNYLIAARVFEKLLKLPMSYYEKRQSGDIIARFGSIDKIRGILTEGLVEGIVDGFMSFATLIVMLVYSKWMGMVTLTFAAGYFFIRYARFQQNKSYSDKLIKANAIQSTFFMETIRGMQTIKIFAKEKYRLKNWLKYYIDFLNSANDSANQQIFFTASKNTLFGCEILIIILIGCISILNKSFTLGMLYAFIFYRTQFVNAMGRFIDNLLEYKMLSLHVDRLSDMVLEQSEQRNREKKLTIEAIDTLEVKDLSYRYGEFEDYVLKNINLKVNFNESIAITAPSGYGKTTLFKLMMGLLEPTHGQILVNGVPLSNINIQNYRNLIASVMQEDSLFAGNIYENIAFFSPHLDKEKVVECAKMAAVHEEIMKMPMNYYTLVGDMGTVLSGGQKQRILLARALYHEPKVIFLDEATSHLDILKEQQINDTLKKINITKVIIAHRLETIAMADRVIDLSKKNSVDNL